MNKWSRSFPITFQPSSRMTVLDALKLNDLLFPVKLAGVPWVTKTPTELHYGRPPGPAPRLNVFLPEAPGVGPGPRCTCCHVGRDAGGC